MNDGELPEESEESGPESAPDFLPQTPASKSSGSKSLTPAVLIKALSGSVAGVIIGVAGFTFLLKYGLYAIVLPGAAVGLGTGLMSRRASWTFAIYSGVVGAVLCLLLHWKYFRAGTAFSEFLGDLGNLPTDIKLRMAAGVVAAVWFGRGRHS